MSTTATTTTTTTIMDEQPYLQELVQAFSFDVSPSLSLYSPPTPPPATYVSYYDDYDSTTEWGSQWEGHEGHEQERDGNNDDVEGEQEDDLVSSVYEDDDEEEDLDDLDDDELVQPLTMLAPPPPRLAVVSPTPLSPPPEEQVRIQRNEERMDALERAQELLAQARHEQFQERLHAQIQAQLGAIQQSRMSSGTLAQSQSQRLMPPTPPQARRRSSDPGLSNPLQAHPINDTSHDNTKCQQGTVHLATSTASDRAMAQRHENQLAAAAAAVAAAEREQAMAAQRHELMQQQLAFIHEHRMTVIRQQQAASMQAAAAGKDQALAAMTEQQQQRLSIIPEESHSYVPTPEQRSVRSVRSNSSSTALDEMPTFFLSSSGEGTPVSPASSVASPLGKHADLIQQLQHQQNDHHDYHHRQQHRQQMMTVDPLCRSAIITTVTGPSTPTPLQQQQQQQPGDVVVDMTSWEYDSLQLNPPGSGDDDDAAAGQVSTFRWLLADLQQRAVGSLNSLACRYGGTGFMPDSLAHECDKAAVILRAFCRKGVYADYTAAGRRQKMHRAFLCIPPRVIARAAGLVIFTEIRAGLQVSGATGSGILIAKLPDGRWGPPSAIHVNSVGGGVVLLGIDVHDSVMIINSRKALETFMNPSVRLGGGEVTVVAGPWGVSGQLEWAATKNGPDMSDPAQQRLAPTTPQSHRRRAASVSSLAAPPSSSACTIPVTNLVPTNTAEQAQRPNGLVSPPSSPVGDTRHSYLSVSSLSSYAPSPVEPKPVTVAMDSSSSPSGLGITLVDQDHQSPVQQQPQQQEQQQLLLRQQISPTVEEQPLSEKGESQYARLNTGSNDSHSNANTEAVARTTGKRGAQAPRFAPVYSYTKSRGLYAGLGCDTTTIRERAEANAEFYGEPVTTAQILQGQVASPQNESLQNLYDVLRGIGLGARKIGLEKSARRRAVDTSVETVIRNTYVEAAGTNNLFDSVILSGSRSTRREVLE